MKKECAPCSWFVSLPRRAYFLQGVLCLAVLVTLWAGVRRRRTTWADAVNFERSYERRRMYEFPQALMLLPLNSLFLILHPLMLTRRSFGSEYVERYLHGW